MLRPGIQLDKSFLGAKAVLPPLVKILLMQILHETRAIGWYGICRGC